MSKETTATVTTTFKIKLRGDKTKELSKNTLSYYNLRKLFEKYDFNDSQTPHITISNIKVLTKKPIINYYVRWTNRFRKHEKEINTVYTKIKMSPFRIYKNFHILTKVYCFKETLFMFDLKDGNLYLSEICFDNITHHFTVTEDLEKSLLKLEQELPVLIGQYDKKETIDSIKNFMSTIENGVTPIY